MTNHEVIDGLIIDLRLEHLVSWAFFGGATPEEYDRVFNEVVREFLNGTMPFVKASEIMEYGSNPQLALNLMASLSLDFRVSHRHNTDWPIGVFEAMQDAAIAVCVSRGDEEWAAMAPGYTFNQAVVGSVVEYIREMTIEQLNQNEFVFH